MNFKSRMKPAGTVNALAAAPAVLAMILALAGTDRAGAAERVKDEVSRVPVFYKTGGNCTGTGCYKDIVTTPGNKKRIELSSVTCNILADTTGYLAFVELHDGEGASDRVMYMSVNHNTTVGNNQYFTASSTARFRLKKNTTYTIRPAGSDLSYTACTATGELIKYD